MRAANTNQDDFLSFPYLSFWLIKSINFQALNRNDGQVQLIDGIEHPGQGGLVAQLAQQERDR